MGNTVFECILMLPVLVGCHASVNADAKLNTKAPEESSSDIVQNELSDKAGAQNDLLPRSDTLKPGVALLGARRDLGLVSERASAMCACVKVGLGGAASAAFQWQSTPPQIDDDTELVVALSSEGLSCKGQPKGDLGASYWGYRIAGNDVIVFVEGARPGRPRMTGAIIPKPVGSGAVYMAPASRALPYGRAVDGKGNRCVVGNAAVPRAKPFSDSELGTPETAARPRDEDSSRRP